MMVNSCIFVIYLCKTFHNFSINHSHAFLNSVCGHSTQANIPVQIGPEFYKF